MGMTFPQWLINSKQQEHRQLLRIYQLSRDFYNFPKVLENAQIAVFNRALDEFGFHFNMKDNPKVIKQTVHAIAQAKSLGEIKSIITKTVRIKHDLF